MDFSSLTVSVAMATYNGEAYIEEQIVSILNQISEKDEIIISDDGSTDNTLNIILKYSMLYPQVKLINGPSKGIVKNFENAILNCKNDIIFLSDQDDVWVNSKIKKILDIFENNDNIFLILHNANIMCGTELTNIKLIEKYREGWINNILKSSYWGCCMAFRKEIISSFIPFDDKEIAHDQIIGLICEKKHFSYFYDKPLIYHRLHNNNKTQKQKLKNKVIFRIKLLNSFLKRI